MRSDPNGHPWLDWKKYGYTSHEAFIESKAGANPPDPFNPSGELCAACGQPAKGYAFIDDARYCHGDEPGETCYEAGQGTVTIEEIVRETFGNPQSIRAWHETHRGVWDDWLNWPQELPPPFAADDEGEAEPSEVWEQRIQARDEAP